MDMKADHMKANHMKANHMKADHMKADHMKADHMKANHMKANIITQICESELNIQNIGRAQSLVKHTLFVLRVWSNTLWSCSEFGQIHFGRAQSLNRQPKPTKA